MNIWFLRMDKDGWDEFDLSENYKYIHSIHGSCRKPNGNLDLVHKHKNKIFPEFTLNGRVLARLVRSIKQKLIFEGKIDERQSGKRRCDIAIRYWLSVMDTGDLVFARNKQGKVILCRISGYISEDFFDRYGCFQRPVEIIKEITESMVPSEIWRRTQGRKTIERNAKNHITNLVENNYKLWISLPQ